MLAVCLAGLAVAMAVTSDGLYLGLGLLDGHCLLAAVNHQPAAANHQPSTACLSATACLRLPTCQPSACPLLPTYPSACLLLPATTWLPAYLPAIHLSTCLPVCSRQVVVIPDNPFVPSAAPLPPPPPPLRPPACPSPPLQATSLKAVVWTGWCSCGI